MEDITTQNPVNNSHGKQLLSYEWVREAGAFVYTTDQEVPHGTFPNTPTQGHIEATVRNDRNTAKSRRINKYIFSAPTAVVDKSVPEPNLDKFIPRKDKTSKFEAFGVAPETGFLYLGSTVDEVNKANSFRVTEVASEFEPRTSVGVDEDGAKIEVVETIVPIGDAVADSENGITVSAEEISCTKKLVKTTTKLTNPVTITDVSCEPETCLQQHTTKQRLDSVSFDGTSFDLVEALAAHVCEPGVESAIKQSGTDLFLFTTTLTGWEDYERVFYATQPFTFPSYLLATGIQPEATFLPEVGQTLFSLTFDVRWGWSEQVEVKVVETLLDVDPGHGTTGEIEPIRTTDLLYDGVMFKFQLQNLLVDSFTLTATANSSDTYYGPSATESVTVTATELSASEYVALVAANNWHLISNETVPWKFCLYKNRKTYVKFK